MKNLSPQKVKKLTKTSKKCIALDDTSTSAILIAPDDACTDKSTNSPAA